MRVGRRNGSGEWFSANDSRVFWIQPRFSATKASTSRARVRPGYDDFDATARIHLDGQAASPCRFRAQKSPTMGRALRFPQTAVIVQLCFAQPDITDFYGRLPLKRTASSIDITPSTPPTSAGLADVQFDLPFEANRALNARSRADRNGGVFRTPAIVPTMWLLDHDVTPYHGAIY